MDFVFAMSVFSAAADVSREKGKAQEWLRAWISRDDGKGAAASGQGEAQQRQNDPGAQQARERQGKKLEGRRPWLAPEFDGLNCFETFVSH